LQLHRLSVSQHLRNDFSPLFHVVDWLYKTFLRMAPVFVPPRKYPKIGKSVRIVSIFETGVEYAQMDTWSSFVEF
jgi:hypothetical protein